jgi:hypothetical protein
MSQVNLRVDAQFENDLFAVMAAMRIVSKSQAIRFAVHEVAEAFRRRESGQTGAKHGGHVSA